MALPSRIALLEAKEDLYRVAIAGVIVVALTAATAVAIRQGRSGRGERGDAPKPPAGPGFVGCAPHPIKSRPLVGDYVAVPLLDEHEGFVEWAWLYVQSVDEAEEAVYGVLTSAATGALLASDRHRFRAGQEIGIRWTCLGDRLRAGYNAKGEPVCAAYGSLVHEQASKPQAVDPRPGMVVLATVGPRSPGMVPAVDAMEAVRVRVDALSPLKMVQGRIISATTKTSVHGYEKGDVIDLPADCIYGALT